MFKMYLIDLSSFKGSCLPSGAFWGHDAKGRFVLGKVNHANNKLEYIRVFIDNVGWSEKIYL